jgi:hypothetical protein
MVDVSPSLSEISNKINTSLSEEELERIINRAVTIKEQKKELEGMKLYSNQEKAANDMLIGFIESQYRYCLLRANEQAGKTGTYHHLIRLMFERNLIDNVYIICGSSELELLNQCHKDLEEWHKKQPYNNNIHIIFHQHFDMTTIIVNRSLIVVDESHLVQGIDQKLYAFLAKHKLSMAGTTSDMIENGTYMVSVDATPYSEESAIAWKNSSGKFKVVLEDGENYFGVKQYYDNQLIFPTFELGTPTGKHHLQSLLKVRPNKYILVRFHSSNKQQKWFLKWAKEVNCDILYFTSNYKGRETQITINKDTAKEHYKLYKKTIPCLENAPLKTTIVIIDGRLRCGKRVPKKHIGFIWEATKVGKTDIIRQGLLGRMCGYEGNDDEYNVPLENKPLIYIPGNLLKKEDSKKVITLCDLERSFYDTMQTEEPSENTIIGPRKFNNSIPGTISNIQKRNGLIMTQCIPIRFQLNLAQTQHLRTIGESRDDEKTIKMYCLQKLCDDKDILIGRNNNLTDEQKEEILCKIESLRAELTHYRGYRGTSNANMYKRHIEAYMDNTSSKEVISDAHFLTFCVVFPDFIKPEGVSKPTVPGEVYAIFYTYAKGYIRTIDKESRISKSKQTHFMIQPTNEVIDCPAGSVYGFSPKILVNSDDMIKEFDYFIEYSKKGIGCFSKRFTSLHNGEYITLPRNVYGQDLEILDQIFKNLEQKHSIKISYKCKKRRILSDFSNDIELKFISWE